MTTDATLHPSLPLPKSKIKWSAVRKWRDLLRSGKFRQGQSALKTTFGYCCLGVFCEKVAKINHRKIDGYFYFAETDFSLPKLAQKKLGVYNSDPFLFGVRASNLNDNGLIDSKFDHIPPLTFDEIADLLDIALIEREGIQ